MCNGLFRVAKIQLLLELEKLLPLKNIFYFLCAHLMGEAAGLIETFLPAECMGKSYPCCPPENATVSVIHFMRMR